MSEVCLHLLTKEYVSGGGDALEQIWSIDNWIKSLDRVIDITVSLETESRQLFALTFDAGRSVPDKVQVERVRTPNMIQVKHLIPPPGLKSLEAVWWCEGGENKELFARRTAVMDQSDFSASRAIGMFHILRENIFKLVGGEQCN